MWQHDAIGQSWQNYTQIHVNYGLNVKPFQTFKREYVQNIEHVIGRALFIGKAN